MTATVTLVGLAGDQLPPGARQALAAAQLVIGAAPVLHRHVVGPAADPSAERPSTESPSVESPSAEPSSAGAPSVGLLEVPSAPGLPKSAWDALSTAVEAGRSVVVLVSGDPGYFGALRELRN